MKWTGEQLAAAAGGEWWGEGELSGPVSTDTRDDLRGRWFLAIEGARFDGHTFLRQAVESGAIGIVSRHKPDDLQTPWVQVEDTTLALQCIGAAARDRLKGPVVGLTGTAGKTTTRAFIEKVLQPLGAVHTTVGNLNNHLGVPMTLMAAPEDVDACVVEMGTSGPGEIAVLTRIARPDVRLVINVGPGHLEELGSVQGVAEEKTCLYTEEPGESVRVVNLDDVWLAPWAKGPDHRVVTYGHHEDADIRIRSVELRVGEWRTVAELDTPEGVIGIVLPMVGEHFAHNAAAAMAVAHALGVPLAEAAEGLSTVEPVGMRMKRIELPEGAIALNDAYNANPTSMLASLQVLAALPGRRFALLGDMLELGGDEVDFHRTLVEQALALPLHKVLVVGERMEQAARGMQDPRLRASLHLEDLLPDLSLELQRGDLLLVKGSRGARMERALSFLSGTDDREAHS